MAPRRFNRNREPHSHPCPPGCTCKRHTSHCGGSKPCPEGCTCGKHDRSQVHNMLIGQSVSRTAKLKKQRERDNDG